MDNQKDPLQPIIGKPTRLPIDTKRILKRLGLAVFLLAAIAAAFMAYHHFHKPPKPVKPVNPSQYPEAKNLPEVFKQHPPTESQTLPHMRAEKQ